MRALFAAVLLASSLSGCATVVARHEVPGDTPRLSYPAAKKALQAAFKRGLLEKRGFVAATMNAWKAEVGEEGVALLFDRYLSLVSQQTVATKLACAYADLDGSTLVQYKTGGAGRAAYLTYEVPLGAACGDLAMFYGDRAAAEDFARALRAMKLRAELGPTPEEVAAARPAPAFSREDLATIVQAAVAGAAGGKPGDAPKPAPSSDVDRPAYRFAERPRDFAVVVGIGRYSDIPEAQFADRDGEAVKEHLLALGFPSRNVVHLTGEKAGYKGIEKFVETWLPRNAEEGSRVVFYFSGHGAPDPQTGRAYLLPYDGDPNFLENTGYPIERLYRKLGELRAREVVVALDACFSGAGGRSVLAKGARPLVARVEDASVPPQLTVFAAASGEQITSTLEEQGHGTFTYYFLKGLGGAARGPGGTVTARGLHDYLKPKVQDAARRQNRDQEPVLHGSGSLELVRH
ncbi:MAG: caspase family protein [Elusimicrobiota bacterium]|nr:caspase family protein [Elusimicrobiota bacterium]